MNLPKTHLGSQKLASRMLPESLYLGSHWHREFYLHIHILALTDWHPEFYLNRYIWDLQIGIQNVT